jgi:hypothetical protein
MNEEKSMRTCAATSKASRKSQPAERKHSSNDHQKTAHHDALLCIPLKRRLSFPVVRGIRAVNGSKADETRQSNADSNAPCIKQHHHKKITTKIPVQHKPPLHQPRPQGPFPPFHPLPFHNEYPGLPPPPPPPGLPPPCPTPSEGGCPAGGGAIGDCDAPG